MPELLLELGTEELPASFVEKAYNDLLGHISVALKEAGVLTNSGVAFGTPRRLIISIPNLLWRQEDQIKEMRGPSLKGAFDAEGNPTPALIGFCRGQGADPKDVRKDDQYVWVSKKILGRNTAELLAEALPKAIRSLTFEKSMRWGAARMRFARPIRWILATLDGQTIPFEVEGVESGNESRGHRFYHPENFIATTTNELVDELRSRKVQTDPSVRRETIVQQATAVANGVPDLPEDLVEENVFLTEWPTAICGQFRTEYLELPEAVLVIAMAKHEKMFPVRDHDGKLTDRFVFIRNSGEDDSVRAGCEWVLNARFNDAKFFYDEDRKCMFEEFLNKTEGILFQQKLGTVRARAERLATLSQEVARQTTPSDDSELEYAYKAGLLCKADLSTGLVGELPALQGIIGGSYARREGITEAVCWAIASHYDLSKNQDPTNVNGRTAVRVLIADQLDKLAGYLGLGLVPNGSSDPFALRRAATLLIEAAWLWPGEFPDYASLFELALRQYAIQSVELNHDGACAALEEVFASRYTSMLPEIRRDLLDASIETPSDPRKVKFRIKCLERLISDQTLVQTATRPLNIVAAAIKKDLEFAKDDPLGSVHLPNLQSEEGINLYNALTLREAELGRAIKNEDVESAAKIIADLVGPINSFFDNTMIMVEDDEVRFARLTLLNAVTQQLLSVGNFGKLE